MGMRWKQFCSARIPKHNMQPMVFVDMMVFQEGRPTQEETEQFWEQAQALWDNMDSAAHEAQELKKALEWESEEDSPSADSPTAVNSDQDEHIDEEPPRKSQRLAQKSMVPAGEVEPVPETVDPPVPQIVDLDVAHEASEPHVEEKKAPNAVTLERHPMQDVAEASAVAMIGGKDVLEKAQETPKKNEEDLLHPSAESPVKTLQGAPLTIEDLMKMKQQLQTVRD